MSRRGWLLFAAMCVIWGIPYLLIKVAVKEITPPELVFWRTTIGALLLVPVAAARRELRPLLRAWAPLLVYTVVEIGVPWVLLSEAEQRLTSSLTGLLVAAVPLVGALLVRTTGERERLDRRRLAGLLIGLGGVAALVGLDVRSANVGALVAMAAVVVGYALGPILLARYLSDLPSLGVVGASLGLCALAYAPIGIADLPARLPGWHVLAAVAVLGVVCTAVAFLMFFRLIAEVGPVRSTVITYVNPAVAVALGVLLLGEPFTLGIGCGFVLVLAGSVLATAPGRSRPAAVEELQPPVAAA